MKPMCRFGRSTAGRSAGGTRLLILLTQETRRVPPSLRRAGATNACLLCGATAKRNDPPSLVHPHHAKFAEKIETITAPAPLFGRLYQSASHRIPMDVPQLLDALSGRPYIEVVG